MNRFKYLVLTLCFTLTWPAFAAPLFPDVPDNHWAKDAVAALAAKGLVEGYPDGTFKGDRAASRWETAMIVARLLAKMEQAHATFATKAELDELRKLTNALREELDALGVRVDNLEENVGRLDKRVTELERITFYGFVDARVSFQQINSTGRNSARSLNPAVGFDLINYNAAAGSAAGAGGFLAPVSGAPALGGLQGVGFTGPVPTFNPFTTGVLGTTNWQTGRPLTSGTGFTTRAVLGMNIDVSDSIEAGVEFSAYTSQGDQIVDAYYGVQQPYLSNPFTATNVTGGTGAQALNNQPYTRMNLDHFWIRHVDSGTKLIVGAFNENKFNGGVFKGMLNPNESGPEYLDNYGFLVDGGFFIDEEEDTKINWQVMGTVLPDGSAGSITPGAPGAGTSYFSHAEGVKVGITFHEERGHVNFNFLHAGEDAQNGAALGVGNVSSFNLSRQINWVNPPGFYINQLAGINGATAGFNSTTDIRPVPMLNTFGNDGSLAPRVNAGLLPQGVPNVGGVGPQDQNTWGLEFDYTFDASWSPRIFGEYATSTYRPNKNSKYSVDGDAFKFGLGALLLDGDLDLEAQYLSVDSTFSPFIITVPTISGVSTPLWHTPDFHYFQNLYSLHDTKALPHNREGFRLKGTWKFAPTGRVIVEYGNFNQKKSSLQGVRFSQNSIAPGTPNTTVLGNLPGHLEPLFPGYHPATFAAANGNALAIPLEDNKGEVQNLYISGGYKWLLDEANNNRGITVKGGVKGLAFDRKTNMQNRGLGQIGTQAANQNLVDLGFVGWHLEVDYDVTETFVAKAGFTNVDIKGHFDPFNTGGQYAATTGVFNHNNLDITQTWPELGFEWELEDNLTWSANGRYYTFKDNVPAHVFTNPTVPALNINNGPTATHPFSWEGIQIQSQFSLKF